MEAERQVDCRILLEEEFEHGHAILCDAYDWLRSRGIRKWTAPLPREIYREWQGRNANHGLFPNGDLVAVFSLVWGPLEEWPGVEDSDDVLWLHALATSRRHRHQGLGQDAVKRAFECAANQTDVLYLSCALGAGFLPSYYQRLGFEQLQRETKHYGEYGAYDMVLMRREL